nr:MAG TPA: hypothetical protein [Caudoviricetes sp.]
MRIRNSDILSSQVKSNSGSTLIMHPTPLKKMVWFHCHDWLSLHILVAAV